MHNFLVTVHHEKDLVTDHRRRNELCRHNGHPEKKGDRFVDNDNIQVSGRFLATQSWLDDHHCQHVAFVTSHHFDLEVDRRLLRGRQCLNERGLVNRVVVEEDNAPQFLPNTRKLMTGWSVPTTSLVPADLPPTRSLGAPRPQLKIICLTQAGCWAGLPAIDRADSACHNAAELLFNRRRPPIYFLAL